MSKFDMMREAVTEAEATMRVLEELQGVIGYLPDGPYDRATDAIDTLRAHLSDHLSDPGYVRVGHVAMCDDGSVCYDYFAQTKEGVELAIKNDGWEGMRAVPVYVATKENSHG